MIKQFIYLPIWFLNAKLLRKHKPLQTVLFITDYCNLQCKHCTDAGHAAKTMKSYDNIRGELTYAYTNGSRFVDFEGGEPTLWRDRDYQLNDLVHLAKQIGFFSATVTSNGQLPLTGCMADSIWVSVDGYREAHDRVRGTGTFEKLDQTIKACHHPSLSINMAINRLNKNSVYDTIRYAKENPAIKSISLNFHTPYPGTEELMLPWEERCQIIDEILSCKQQGYPIMNSRSGLKVMQNRGFKKDCWVSSFILADGTRLDACPGKTVGICNDCGFCMAGETCCVLRLKPDTLLSAIKLRL